MDIIKFLSEVRDYIHGFLELATIQTPRYHFVVETFRLSYQSNSIKTKVNYTPIGCYRPLLNYADELNIEIICRKFKPDHARMIIGINTLEKTLDFNCKEQTKTYLKFVAACTERLKETRG